MSEGGGMRAALEDILESEQAADEVAPSLRLRIIERMEGACSAQDEIEFTVSGGDIGRAPGRTWVLEHPAISGLHAIVSFQAGRFFLKDVSRNGTFRRVPHEANRLPAEQAVELKNGDQLCLSRAFTVLVSIHAPNARLQASGESSAGDDLPAWVESLLNQEQPARAEVNANSGSRLSASNGFESGLGLKNAPLTDDQLESAGRLFRLLVKGLMDAIEVRRRFRNEFSAAPTRVGHGPGSNTNPLKALTDVDVVIGQLLTASPEEGFVDGRDALEEALADSVAHQIALLDAIRAGFDHTLQSFAPERVANLGTASWMSPPGLFPWFRYKSYFSQLEADRRWAFRELFEGPFCETYDAREGRYKEQALDRLRSEGDVS